MAARGTAKKNAAGRTTQTKRRIGTVLWWDGREPLAFDAAITLMTTERGPIAPAADGNGIGEWGRPPPSAVFRASRTRPESWTPA